MLLRIHPRNPELRKIQLVVDILQNGGVIIYPTDTVYAIGCSIMQPRALERIARIKGVDTKKVNFSIICHSLSNITDYAFNIDTPVYRIMKRTLPGPYTFILRANSNVPKIFQSKKKTVGIRVPNNKIPLTIVEELGVPIISTSIHNDDKIVDYITDPALIYEKFEKLIDVIIDGGFGGNKPSTVLDCTDKEIIVLREGLGKLEGII
ncbi:MAG: L-threonylcarbamoyladenylate synthase [Ignavibacteria bacterium]